MLQTKIDKAGENDLVVFGIYFYSEAENRAKVRFKNKTGIEVHNYGNLDEDNRDIFMFIFTEEMIADVENIFYDFYHKEVNIWELPDGGKVYSCWLEPYFGATMRKVDMINLSKDKRIIRMIGEGEFPYYPM